MTILAVGDVTRKPVVEDGGQEVAAASAEEAMVFHAYDGTTNAEVPAAESGGRGIQGR